jgi:hypothetical protein
MFPLIDVDEGIQEQFFPADAQIRSFLEHATDEYHKVMKALLVFWIFRGL